MLNVIEYGKDEYDFPALLVLGCFDAIHVGHRELIKKAKLQAKINGLDLGVMLFRDGKGGKTVYSFEERLALLEEFNVKFVLVIDYTPEFQATAPLDFLHTVEEKVNVKAYMSGKDFRFGAKAKGKSSTLKNYAEDEDNGVWYMPVKDVTVNDEKVSTTLIKTCLENGDVATANELLGLCFCVNGEVVKGEGRGAGQLGYPTANIIYPESKFPVKYGVYAVKSMINGTEYFGIANYGNCPTFGDERIALEVHFEGFEGDLYGQTLNIQFINYLRDIIEFASTEELKVQLDKDKEAVKLLITESAEEPKQHTEAVVHSAPVISEHVKEEVVQPKVTEQAVSEEAVAQPEIIEEAVVEEASTEHEQAVDEVFEEVAQPEVTEQTIAEEIAITANEYKDLASGFDDVVERSEEEILPEQKPEETTVEESAEVVEVAEEIVEEQQTEDPEALGEGLDEVFEQPVEFEEVIEESEQAVEEISEGEKEEAAEEVTENVEEVTETTVDETAAEPVEQAEEEYEVVDGGFDDIVEEPIEELVQMEESVKETAEEIHPEDEQLPEESEMTAEENQQTEEVVEVIEEEQQPEEDNNENNEDKID